MGSKWKIRELKKCKLTKFKRTAVPKQGNSQFANCKVNLHILKMDSQIVKVNSQTVKVYSQIIGLNSLIVRKIR